MTSSSHKVLQGQQLAPIKHIRTVVKNRREASFGLLQAARMLGTEKSLYHAKLACMLVINCSYDSVRLNHPVTIKAHARPVDWYCHSICEAVVALGMKQQPAMQNNSLLGSDQKARCSCCTPGFVSLLVTPAQKGLLCTLPSPPCIIERKESYYCTARPKSAVSCT